MKRNHQETHMDNLLSRGAEFDALLSRWRGTPQGEERDDICDILNEKAEAIRLAPCTSLGDLALKARAVAWICYLDPWFSRDDDLDAHILADFLKEVERTSLAPSQPAMLVQ